MKSLGKQFTDFDLKEMEDIELSSVGLTRVRLVAFETKTLFLHYLDTPHF